MAVLFPRQPHESAAITKGRGEVEFDRQLILPLDKTAEPRFPSTRFQGSKSKLVDWIWDSISGLEFDSALDAFGGTASVAHRLKRAGKRVAYNDLLSFNSMIGQALIENSHVRLSEADMEQLTREAGGVQYPTFIQDTFRDINYTEEENRWLDIVVTNIGEMENRYKKALAFFALFQACIIKRPFNLFHRKNLYIRFRDVKRSFGNKASWDKPFEHWFRQFAVEANLAVFDNGVECKAMNCEPTQVPGRYDLVYIDTPYISAKGVGVDYLHFYHFLEGLTDYDNWHSRIDYGRKHRPLKTVKNEWADPKRIYTAFERLLSNYSDSILVVSYRDNGIPTQQELFDLLKQYKSDVRMEKKDNYKYVLSVYGSAELLFIAQ